MKYYTKKGDRGMTALGSTPQISKADDRIKAVGALDELVGQVGFVRALLVCPKLGGKLERVQSTLLVARASVDGPRDPAHTVDASEIAFLESQMDKLEELLDGKKPVLPGSCELSARLDLASAAAKRTERVLAETDRKFVIHQNTKAYVNRLADFLYATARYADHMAEQGRIGEIANDFGVTTSPVVTSSSDTKEASVTTRIDVSLSRPAVSTNDIIDAVVRQIGEDRPIDLAKAKALIEAVEQYAASRGKRCVISVCNSEGNPIAVHVMDGAFLVSYEVAMKKAYTAAALKMPTIELAALTAPGGTFYGLQNLEKMMTIGGGVPLKIGDRVVGGLGVSGGTGEEDHEICEFALKVFALL